MAVVCAHDEYAVQERAQRPKIAIEADGGRVEGDAAMPANEILDTVKIGWHVDVDDELGTRASIGPDDRQAVERVADAGALRQMVFAAFDFARKPVAKLSQMQLVLKWKS